MRKIQILINAIATVIAASISQAALAAPGQWYINPAIGYQVFDNKDDDRDLDEARTVIVGVEYQATRRWGLEFRHLQSSPDNRFGVLGRDTDLRQISLDFLGYLGDDSGWEPFLALGIGHADFDSDLDFGEDRGITQLNVGGGARYLFNPRWSLRSDLRAIHSLGTEHRDALVSLGISYALGTPERRTRPERIIEPELETTDGDASDVDDSDDSCPATPANPDAGQSGCEPMPMAARSEEITLEIKFPNNSAQIPPGYFLEVKKVAEFLRKFSDLEAQIEGHTDNAGSAAYNKRLSQRRADAVKSALVNTYDIDPMRLKATGYGYERPIADNGTAEGRRANRRVVAVIQAEVTEQDSSQQ